jgi:hypothetical protein
VDTLVNALAIFGAFFMLVLVLLAFTPNRSGRVRGPDLPRKENGTIDFDRLGRSSDDK